MSATCGDYGGVSAGGTPCSRRAGWGVEGAATGRCMYHLPDASRPRASTGQVPPPPAGLSAEAAEAWRRVLETGVLDATELLILRGALEHWDTYQRAHAELAAGPLTVDGKVNPVALIARDAYPAFRSAVAQLGLEVLDLGY